jgi:hypothetical protein
MWDTPSDERMGLSFTTAVGSRQRSRFRSESSGTDDHILLLQIRDFSNLEGQVRNQKDSPWSDDMRIPHKSKGPRRSHQRVKRCALSSGRGKAWSSWISWNPDKPLTLTATSQRWRPEGRNFQSCQRRQPFSCNMITQGATPVWRPWGLLQSLAVLSYYVHRVIWILGSSDFHLIELMKDGLRGQHYPDNETVIAAVRKWVASAGAIFTSAARRLLFIAGGDCVER